MKSPQWRLTLSISLFLITPLLLVQVIFASESSDRLKVQSNDPKINDPKSNDPKIQEPSLAKSNLKGRIIFDDTGRPVRRARVTLIQVGSIPLPLITNSDSSIAVYSDRNGKVEFKGVSAGAYYFSVEAPGTIPIHAFWDEDNFHRKGVNENLKKYLTEVIVDGAKDVEITVRIKRGGVITGRVTYGDGELASNVEVRVWRKKEDQTLARYVNLGGSLAHTTPTDDRGVYRIAGLLPGEYLLGAAEPIFRGEDRSQEALDITYYPAATILSRAASIKVEMGEETSGIDITLVERRSHKLSGKVIARHSGHPITLAMVTIQIREEKGAPFLGGLNCMTNEGGEWSFDGVPDGDYVISVAPLNNFLVERESAKNQGQNQPTSSRLINKLQEVTVEGADVEGVVIELPRGGLLSGTVVIDDGHPVPSVVRLFTETIGLDGNRAGLLEAQTFLQSDCTFTLAGIPPGESYLNVMAHTGEAYYVKSILAKGRDLLHKPMKLGDGEALSDVRVVLSSQVARFTGRLFAESRNSPLAESRVTLVPVEPSQWNHRGAHLTTITDSTGAFTMTGAPGEYLILVKQAADFTTSIDADFIKANLATAPRISLKPGEQKRSDIVVPVN